MIKEFLKKENKEKIGSAIWEFMWLIHHYKQIAEGFNLIDLATQLGNSEVTTSRNLARLEEGKYIELTHTPTQITAKILKKCFIKNDKPPKDQDHPDIVLVIDAFKAWNPAARTWYSNRTQRSAAKALIDTHGRDPTLKVISLLPRTNVMPFFPSITTPQQLEQKWVQLETRLRAKKLELEAKRPKYII